MKKVITITILAITVVGIVAVTTRRHEDNLD